MLVIHIKLSFNTETGKKVPIVQTTEDTQPAPTVESHTDPLSTLDPFWATKKEN